MQVRSGGTWHGRCLWGVGWWVVGCWVEDLHVGHGPLYSMGKEVRQAPEALGVTCDLDLCAGHAGLHHCVGKVHGAAGASGGKAWGSCGSCTSKRGAAILQVPRWQRRSRLCASLPPDPALRTTAQGPHRLPPMHLWQTSPLPCRPCPAPSTL